MKRTLPAVLFLSTFVPLGTTAHANSRQEHSWDWPLREPILSADGLIAAGRARRLIYITFGDYGDRLHFGLDIGANHDNVVDDRHLPDVTIIPVDSYLTYVFDHDDCGSRKTEVSYPGEGGMLCRLWFKTQDNELLYYYGHTHYNDANTPGDLEVNSKLANAIKNSLAGAHAGACRDQEACFFGRGDLGPTISDWSMMQAVPGSEPEERSFNHLHMTVVDPKNGYDHINPLILLNDYKDSDHPIVDNVRPTVASVDFVPDQYDSTVPSVSRAGTCGQEISGVVDIAATAWDMFLDPAKEQEAGALPVDVTHPDYGRGQITPYKATYTVKSVSTGQIVQTGTWYEFDRGPMFCVGPDRGNSCAFSDLRVTAASEQDYYERYLSCGPSVGGPQMGILPNLDDAGVCQYPTGGTLDGYNERLYRAKGLKSTKPLIVTNEWGTDTANFYSASGLHTNWDTVATSEDGRFGDDRYQVDVTVYDQEGAQDDTAHSARASAIIRVHNLSGDGDVQKSAFKDIYLRDFPGDVGAIPSLAVEDSYQPSLDILLVPEEGDTGDVPTGANIHEVREGNRYHLWLHVNYGLCNPVSGMKAAFATANGGSLSDQGRWHWITVDGNGQPTFRSPPNGTGSMPANTSTQWVGPFDWTPIYDDASMDNFLFAAVASADDPTATSDMVDVVGHNNVAWRDIAIVPQAPNPAPNSPVTGFQFTSNQEQLKYVNDQGHIFELYHTKEPPLLWCSHDLKEHTGVPNTPAMGAGFVAFESPWNDQQHLIYQESGGSHHIFEMTYWRSEKRWSYKDLTSDPEPDAPAPKADSPMAAYATDFTDPERLHVDYIGDDGYIHELSYDTDHEHWQHVKLKDRPNAQDCPTAVNLVGYATHYLNYPPPAPPEYTNQRHVVYIGGDNNIYEYVHRDGDWYCTKDGNQPKKLNVAPARQDSALSAYVTTYTTPAQQHVIYFGTDQRIHELVNDKGSTEWRRYTPNMGTALPTASSPLVGYTYDNQQDIAFVNMSNHVQELVYDDDNQQWVPTDVTGTATDIDGGIVPHVAVGSRHLAGYSTDWDGQKQRHLVFTSDQGHVYELYHHSNRWNGNDLTANAVQNCPEP